MLQIKYKYTIFRLENGAPFDATPILFNLAIGQGFVQYEPYSESVSQPINQSIGYGCSAFHAIYQQILKSMCCFDNSQPANAKCEEGKWPVLSYRLAKLHDLLSLSRKHTLVEVDNLIYLKMGGADLTAKHTYVDEIYLPCESMRGGPMARSFISTYKLHDC